MTTKKREWVRGEKADVIAGIAEGYLKHCFTANIHELCTVVQREISRQKLDIQLSPSILRNILTADKRKFNFVRVNGGEMHLTSESGLMFNLLKSIEENMRKNIEKRTEGKVSYLRSVPSRVSDERPAISA